MKIPEKLNLDCYNEDKLSRTTIGEQGLSDKIDEIIDYLRFLTRKKKVKNNADMKPKPTPLPSKGVSTNHG